MPLGELTTTWRWMRRRGGQQEQTLLPQQPGLWRRAAAGILQKYTVYRMRASACGCGCVQVWV